MTAVVSDSREERSQGCNQAVRHVLGKRRGPRHRDNSRIITWVDHYCETRKISVTKPAELIAADLSEWMMIPERIRNIHSEHAEDYRITSKGFFMDPERIGTIRAPAS